MKTIKFTIKGNGIEEGGNPLPKLRMTQRQGWKPEVQRYVRYLEHVRRAFLESPDLTAADRRHLEQTMAKRGSKKLIPKELTKAKTWLAVMITWKNHAHGDPENILGAIADALFQDDKHLAVTADFHEKPNGSAETVVTITLP